MTRLTRKLVLHHRENRANAIVLWGHDLLNERVAALRVSHDQSLLAHVRRELVASHVQHLPAQFRNDQRAILGLSVLQDELDHVVLQAIAQRSVTLYRLHWPKTHPELILHQMDGVLMKLIQKGPCLLLRQMLEASLQDAAAIRVRGKVVNVPTE